MGESVRPGINSEGVDDLARLLSAIASEDCAAFRRFRQATLRKVMKTALGVLGDHQAAEDVTQDVFLIVWKRAATFDGRRGGAIAWLSAITRNRSVDYLRSPGARALHDTLDAASELRCLAPTPYDLAEMANLMTVVWGRLDRLPIAEKDLLISAIVEETPYSALARAGNMPLPTLKSKVRRALVRLSQDPDQEIVAVC